MPRHCRRPVAFLLSLLALIPAATRLAAHEGHDHGPKLGDVAAVGPVVLTPQSRQNLRVETVEVAISEFRKTASLLARVQSLPERTARLSARIDGQVGEIYVKLGQKVKSGEALLQLTPRAIDTPAVLLRAPLDGVIMAQNASVGLPFTPETVLIEVADLRQVLVRGVAYENADLSAIKEGTPVTVRLDFFGGESFAGHVERIAPALDPETRTFEIYAWVENQDLRLKPNLQGTMMVGIGESSAGILLPSRAILGGLGNLFVFVETEENTFERRAVVTGIRSGTEVEIVEGVLPGDRVVVRGNYQLQFAAPKTGEAPAAPGTHTHADGSTHKH